MIKIRPSDIFVMFCAMGQNKSHAAKHERAEICILSENVKICHFLFSPNQLISAISVYISVYFL